MNVYVVAQDDYSGDGMGTATAGVFSTREKALEFINRLDPTLTEKQKSDLKEHGYATRPSAKTSGTHTYGYGSIR